VKRHFPHASLPHNSGDCNSVRNTDVGGTSRRSRARLRLAAGCALVAAAVVAVVAAARLHADTPVLRAPLPAYATIERDGLRYEFEALRGRESLVEIGPDGRPGRDVLLERGDAARRLRAALEAELGVDSLDRLVEAHHDAAESLRRLGYL
jgi:hypothetical protein